MDRKKKKPSHYPIFSFRLSTEEEKEQLRDLLAKTQKKLNSDLDKDDRPFCKNEILKSVLEKGLESVLKKGRL